jgi:poly(A) polymerase
MMQSVGRLDAQDWMTAPETVAVMAALAAQGSRVRFVGGCVRDAAIKRAVADIDIDIATPDDPATVMDLLAAAGIKAVPTGIEHGAITAVVGAKAFDVTTLRRDVETDGRHAVVAFTDDWLADAQRRDLTINALYCDADGALYDPLGGLDDLKAGRVRFVGDPVRRIAEDVLRILRFFRLQAQFGAGSIDSQGFAACRAAAASLTTLSGERVAREMFKLLAAVDPLPALASMVEAGVLQQIIPGGAGLARLRDLRRREQRLDLVDPLRRLSALLTGPAAADAVAERWRLGKKDRVRLPAALSPPSDFEPRMPARELRRALHRHGRERVVDWLLLAGADDVSQAQRWRAPSLPIKGRDILALGLDPGPRVGDILSAVEDWWIGGDFAADQKACLEKARRLL